MPRLAPALGLAIGLLTGLLAAGCGSGASSHPTTVDVGPVGAAVSTLPGALSGQQMTALLLTGADLPGLTLRPGVDPTVEQSSSPQLALCHGPGPRLPHQAATLLAKGSVPGQALVFESVAVYADAAAARTAWHHDVTNARTCQSYRSGDVTFTVAPPRPVAVPVAGAQAYQYRLAASDVLSGDVRTLGLRGRTTVLLSSYGKPPDGSDLLTWQAEVARRALARAVS